MNRDRAESPRELLAEDRTVAEVTLLLADIGGYTRFVDSTRMSLLHAQTLIDDLMAAVAGAVDEPLVLSKLEGDATFFYALPDSPEARRAVIDAPPRVLDAFIREQARIESANMCSCEACDRVHDLRLKFVAHAGRAVVRGSRRETDLAGPTVILAHRLLKNSIPADEYLLMTPKIASHLEDDETERTRHGVEEVEDLGSVEVTWLPFDREGIIERIRDENPSNTSLAQKVAQTMHVQIGTMRHAVRGDTGSYGNLPGGETTEPGA